MHECEDHTVPLQKPTRAKRKLGQDKALGTHLDEASLADAAERARYVGSPYHRPPGSPMGLPKDRRYPQASKCDIKWTKETANRALKESIRAGHVSAEWENGLPRRVWHRDGRVLYEAVLSNRELAEYHAYPLNEEREWPADLR
jgi:hypothetical protein